MSRNIEKEIIEATDELKRDVTLTHAIVTGDEDTVVEVAPGNTVRSPKKMIEDTYGETQKEIEQRFGSLEAAVNQAQTSASESTSSAGAAKVSETEAGNSALSAGTSATHALASENKARASEEGAQQAASTAQDSEQAAGESASNARASEIAAAKSEANAEISAEAARVSWTKAEDAEQGAKDSETSAKASETKAGTSETAAKASETSAKASETAAAQAKTDAESSANTALVCQNNAEQAATAAADSEVKVKASETASASSASKASDSETESSESQQKALASETKAQQWAQNPEGAEVEPGQFSAYHWAKLAERYGGTVTNALVFRGAWDASKGAPPVPSPETPDFYKISAAGDIQGVRYETGDNIVWDPVVDEWFRIDNNDRPVTDDLTVESSVIAASASAAKKLDSKKLDKAGGTMTGTLVVDQAGVFPKFNATSASQSAAEYPAGVSLSVVDSNPDEWPFGYSTLLTVRGSDTQTTRMFQLIGNNGSNFLAWRSAHNNNADPGFWKPFKKIWHEGNQGAGSGLDADTVDGLQASQLVRSDTGGEIGGSIEIANGKTVNINNGEHDKLQLGANANGVFLRKVTDSGNVSIGVDTNNQPCYWDGSLKRLYYSDYHPEADKANKLGESGPDEFAARNPVSLSAVIPSDGQWFTLAQVSDTRSGRCCARFRLMERISGYQSMVEFYATVAFGRVPSINVLAVSGYGTGNGFIQGLRVVLDDSDISYGQHRLQVFLHDNRSETEQTQDIHCVQYEQDYPFDNWVLKDLSETGLPDGFSESVKADLTKNGGVMTTGEFYAQGQHRVYHEGFPPPAADGLPDQSSQAGKFLTTDGSVASWEPAKIKSKYVDLGIMDKNSTYRVDNPFGYDPVMVRIEISTGAGIYFLKRTSLFDPGRSKTLYIGASVIFEDNGQTISVTTGDYIFVPDVDLGPLYSDYPGVESGNCSLYVWSIAP